MLKAPIGPGDGKGPVSVRLLRPIPGGRWSDVTVKVYGDNPPLTAPQLPQTVQPSPTKHWVAQGWVTLSAAKTPNPLTDVAVAPAESVTLTVKENLPAVVFLPDTTPSFDRVRPGGNWPPLTDQE